jgi:hypothetical protein
MCNWKRWWNRGREVENGKHLFYAATTLGNVKYILVLSTL